MWLPELRRINTSRQMIDTFSGYNHNLRIGDGEFFNMTNMTSDFYPVLSPRKKRGIYAAPKHCTGMIAKDSLCYVDGSKFVMNEYEVDMDLNDEPKQLISMGAYVIILPDKKYINTTDITDFGSIEVSNYVDQEARFSLCRVDGTDYGAIPAQDTAPINPENGALWIDTSATPHALMQYSASSSIKWTQVATTFVRISALGIGAGLSKGDGVNISGVTVASLTDLNGSFVLHDVGDDFIVITGILDMTVYQADGITVSRSMPTMDFVTECGNRLWGCRYGLSNEGQIVNEIYCSKLGDFKNWDCFAGISTDSWRGSVGTDGVFTGAITHMGFPIFFKENCLHKVYPSEVGAHAIQDTACRGVQKGSEKSLAIVNEVLYYKSRSGICAYDGSLPVEVSYALGDVWYENAVAGSHGNKYYISMADKEGRYHLFVYDTAKRLWHKEDQLKAENFCSCRGDLYCLSGETIITMLGSGTPAEGNVSWMAQTGEIGLSSPDAKYISRLTLRLNMELGARLRVFVQYDFSPTWELIHSVHSQKLGSFNIPIRPKRCDFLRLRLEGVGDCKIYSMTKTIEQGSEHA